MEHAKLARRRRTSWPTLLVLLADALLLWAALALAQQNLTLRAGAVLALLLALTHFYLVLHECVHGAVFSRHRDNELLGHLLGFLIVCPSLARRRSHALHHAWTGHPERDPTNARAVQRLSSLTARQLRVLDVLWRSYVPFLAFNERVGLLLAPFRDRGRPAERREVYIYLAGYALLLWLAPPWAVSTFACAWLLSLGAEELINLPHHLHAPFTRMRLASWQQGSVTHSCAHVPLWSRWVLLHFGLHEAHHRWPTLPWFALPAAHRALAGPALVESELVWSFHQRRLPFSDAFAQYIRPASAPGGSA